MATARSPNLFPEREAFDDCAGLPLPLRSCSHKLGPGGFRDEPPAREDELCSQFHSLRARSAQAIAASNMKIPGSRSWRAITATAIKKKIDAE